VGVFGKKPSNSGDNGFEQSMKNLKAKIVSNFNSVIMDGKVVPSIQVANAAERLIREAAAKDDDLTLEFAGRTSVWINDDVLTKSPTEKAQILFNVVSGSAAVREMNTNLGRGHLNADVAFIGLAFYAHLEANPDFDSVLEELRMISD
jgi:hypothetical protein